MPPAGMSSVERGRMKEGSRIVRPGEVKLSPLYTFCYYILTNICLFFATDINLCDPSHSLMHSRLCDLYSIAMHHSSHLLPEEIIINV